MRSYWKFLWIKIALFVIGIGLLLYFFYDGLKFEILGSIIGLMATQILADFLKSVMFAREEKIKLGKENFTYDSVYYKKTLSIGGGKTHIWYDAIESKGAPYDVKDDPHKSFELDNVIQTNFAAIMEAHRASFIANPTMIRLDDFRREEDGTISLFTSRTAFYNDLVTNRAMDFEFNGDLSVREIFESGLYLTPLNKSKMSNHIGFGAFIFYGNSMIVTHRGGNATLSKNQFTSALAFGFSEDDLRTVHDAFEDDEPKAGERFPLLSTEDLTTGILLVRMAGLFKMPVPRVRELYASNKIHIHSLGFGQLVYTGGKPQFYYAIVIDEDVELSPEKDKEKDKDKKREIDFNKNIVFADGMTLVKNDGYVLKLKKRGSTKTVKAEAEKSFFINYWHLLEMPRINGVPDWVYECKAPDSRRNSHV
ncbi:MAG: hypothetical protein J1F39_04055 [Clostridiales bacterium]|nr:hypothetical protein [Clostridiales bacterium]